MATVFCTQCGQQNPEDSRFCARRGAPQRHLPEAGADRRGGADQRGRGPERQVPAGLPGWERRRGGPVSAAMPSRAYLSIGDVLAQLRPTYPDVTISKIRFLEAE